MAEQQKEQVRPRLLVVFYSLPLQAEQKQIEMGFLEREFNNTLSAVEELKKRQVISDFTWVGCTQHKEADVQRAALRQSQGFHSVNISDQTYEDFTQGFVNGVLRPLCHSHIKDVKYEERLWKAYVSANENFANVIADMYQPGDLIWIHGTALMILPQLVRDKLPDAHIGFFLHAPFPSFEVFRILPVRTQVLEGMLGASLIGFQTYTTASDFLQTCAHVLGQDATMKEITQANGHTTIVDVYPIGIDPDELVNRLALPEVKQNVDDLRKVYDGKKIIIARDRAEKNNGVIQKLLAVEALLTEFPTWQGKITYLQICEPVNPNNAGEYAMMTQVNELVGRINGRFGKVGYVPIELHSSIIKNDDVYALYRVADVALVTPLRAGMNTDVHDYVACCNPVDGPEENHGGVVVISEFAGSARCFGGALIVNPFSKTEVAAALNEALTMENDERAVKYNHNWNYVISHTSFEWGKAFLTDLISTAKKIDNFPVPRLDINAVKSAFDNAKKRLFVMDYDGTLAPIVRDHTLATPSPRVLSVLQKLADNPQNTVYIISGRDKDVLDEWLGSVKRIGLCCEHGSYIRYVGSSEWTNELVEINTLEWKDPVMNLMRYFTERTPGSTVEEKHTSIAWHYRNVDPQYSVSQAQELMTHLKAISSKFPVDVLWGNKVIEARPSGVNKGGALRKILANISPPEPDFILCMGDDKTDEDMFAVVDKTRDTHYSVAVKRKPTQAKAFVREQPAVIHLLEKLTADGSK